MALIPHNPDLLSSLRIAYTLVSSIDPLPDGSPEDIASYHEQLKQIHQYCGQITAYVHGIASASRQLEGDGLGVEWMHNGSGEWGAFTRIYFI
jgi:hypothetical protein